MIREVFSRAAEKQEGSSGIDFLEAILRERPDLEGQMVYFPAQGTVSHTVIIGNEVFKAPKTMDALQDFDTEWQIMQQLEGKGLPVSHITCVGKETVFFGMTRMTGVALGEGFEGKFFLEELRILAQDIAGFVIGMAQQMPLREGEFAVHSDLNCDNILVDPVTKKLSGIIDFGYVAYCPAYSIPSYAFSLLGDKDGAFEKMLREEFALRRPELSDPSYAVFKAVPATPKMRN